MSDEIGRRREEGRQRGRWGWACFTDTALSGPHQFPLQWPTFGLDFYLDQKGPRKKRFRLISSSEAIYDIAGEPKWSRPPTRWEVHAVSRGLHHNEPREREDELHVRTTGRSRCCGHECIMQSSAVLFHCLGLDAVGNTSKRNAANLEINNKRMKYTYILKTKVITSENSN